MEIDKGVFDAMLSACEDTARTLMLIANGNLSAEDVDDHLDRIHAAARNAYKLANPGTLYAPGCLSETGYKLHKLLLREPAGLSKTEIRRLLHDKQGLKVTGEGFGRATGQRIGSLQKVEVTGQAGAID